MLPDVVVVVDGTAAVVVVDFVSVFAALTEEVVVFGAFVSAPLVFTDGLLVVVTDAPLVFTDGALAAPPFGAWAFVIVGLPAPEGFDEGFGFAASVTPTDSANASATRTVSRRMSSSGQRQAQPSCPVNKYVSV